MVARGEVRDVHPLGADAQMAGVWDGKRMDPNGLIGGKKKAAPQE
jgi:hypothetical protein